MKKRLIVTMCVCVMGLSGCGQQDEMAGSVGTDMEISEGTNEEMEQSEQIEPTEQDMLEETVEGNAESDFGTDTQNEIKESEMQTQEVDGEVTELTDNEMLELFFDKFYGGGLPDDLTWDGAGYVESVYYDEITYYWEVVAGVTDISNHLQPLFFTDMKYYTKEDFEDLSWVVVHLAKNEIYAKHGYIFKNEDLNKYFRGCAWYQPLYTSEEFDNSVFNDYERSNLELLVELEKEKAEESHREESIGAGEGQEQQSELEDASKKLTVEEAWEYLKNAYFCEIELEDKEYDENGNWQVVIGRTEMPFFEDDLDRPCESIVFFDSEEDSYYMFGYYHVYYEENEEEVFATKTAGWYEVDFNTGEVRRVV